MKIVSIFYGSLCSGAALVCDGQLKGAVSEERFSRIKNDVRFPSSSIDCLLEENGLTKEQIDLIAYTTNDVGIDYVLLEKNKWSVSDYLKENIEYFYPLLYQNKNEDLIFNIMAHKLNFQQEPRTVFDRIKNEGYVDVDVDYVLEAIKLYFNVDASRIVALEHHESHARYSYYGSPYVKGQVLSFTADGWGDGKNATIGIFDQNGKYTVMHEDQNNHIARIYRYITLLLGMKPSEHEYKVMGLAPYGNEGHSQKALDVFSNTLQVDGLSFAWNEKPTDSYYYFKDRLEGIRFDNIAWALQTWTEDLLTRWVKNAIAEYRIHDIIFSGGVAMNIKAMGKILELPEVKSLHVGGSASDESHIISSAIYAAEKYDTKFPTGKRSIKHLYLGPKNSSQTETKAVEKLDYDKYVVIPNHTNKDVIRLILDGKIVGRCVDHMEFGQRSLGNRSILADPRNLEIKEIINSAIKNRDFWMPFAPILMDKYVDKYLINPKQASSPYMTIGFDTTSEGYHAMKAACHPADKSCRPQILKRSHNRRLYALLEEFEAKTQRGALLNTSFNLHGFPIVNTVSDALYVFNNSQLDALELNNYLIIKN